MMFEIAKLATLELPLLHFQAIVPSSFASSSILCR
jgi:hypothetical protein